jgi:2-acetamido-4-(D-alanylamino)-2,4,6-trideoxy-D-mannopyranose transferase
MQKTFIIAEAGVNHNGSMEIAKKLIDEAKKAGADAVKFQTWITEELIDENTELAIYQKENTSGIKSQYEMLKGLELSFDNFRELKMYCDTREIIFMSTPDEMKSALFLNDLQEIFKIGSGDMNNIPLLELVSSFNKPMIVSTGMATLDEVAKTVECIRGCGLNNENLTLLHATTDYPTSYPDVNLKAMIKLRDEFGVNVGYSDHTIGSDVSIAAVALGAKVIEKHFTLNKEMEGPDHFCSSSPNELSSLIQSIRNIEVALGNGIKKPVERELRNAEVVKKRIVAKKTINKGETMNSENLTLMRKNTGVSANEWNNIIGTLAKKGYNKGQSIEWK